jgi:hypothetical protein
MGVLSTAGCCYCTLLRRVLCMMTAAISSTDIEEELIEGMRCAR